MPLDIASYTARISSANPAQLCVITFEILIERIDQALASDPGEPAYTQSVEKARQALQTLMQALDMDNEIAQQLFPLYVFADKLLVDAYFSGNNERLQEARAIFGPLTLAYRAAETADVPENTKQSVLKPSQQVYAGITYSGGKLDEFVVQDNSRGFKG
ncbi:MAG: flagellar protein FliS [Defluviitaleaceae bacterium]|nr:flagellar protein FliS [Defluviitaleaceae bacterium]